MLFFIFSQFKYSSSHFFDPLWGSWRHGSTSEATEPHCVAIFQAGLQALQGFRVSPGEKGTALLGKIGSGFRKWCRCVKKVEIPPCVFSLHLVGRAENDKVKFPELCSNVKAIHCKIILFFMVEIAKEISTTCQCISMIIFISYVFQNNKKYGVHI